MQPSPDSRTSYALIGFPSSGKTTIGQLLATHLALPWLDADHEIEHTTGRSPAHWLQSEGEPAFRLIERDWLRAWQPVSACVLSTGGGLPCFHDNLQTLKHKAVTIYLALDFETLASRLYAPPGHALTRLYEEAGLRELYRHRGEIYAGADLRIDASGSPDEVLARLLQALKA